MRFTGRFLEHMSSALQRNRNLLEANTKLSQIPVSVESAPLRLPQPLQQEKQLSAKEREILIREVLDQNEEEVHRKTVMWIFILVGISVGAIALRIAIAFL